MALQSHLALPVYLSALLQEVGSTPEAHIFTEGMKLFTSEVQDCSIQVKVNRAAGRRMNESLKPQLIKSMLNEVKVLCQYTVFVQGQFWSVCEDLIKGWDSLKWFLFQILMIDVIIPWRSPQSITWLTHEDRQFYAHIHTQGVGNFESSIALTWGFLDGGKKGEPRRYTCWHTESMQTPYRNALAVGQQIQIQNHLAFRSQLVENWFTSCLRTYFVREL